MRYLLLIFPLWLMATDIQPYVALQMGYGNNVKEAKFYNPQGRFGVRINTEYGLSPYIEHISSIPNAKDGQGFNMIGVNMISPSYKDFDVVVGYGYKIPNFNNKTYSREFSEHFYRYGVRYKSGDKYLYVESIENKMASFGVEFIF